MERIYIQDEDRLKEACELTTDYNEGLDSGDRLMVLENNLDEVCNILSDNDINYDVI